MRYLIKIFIKSLFMISFTIRKTKNKDILTQFEDILSMKCPIVKITDLHHVLDYYESVSKFEWHLKRDDCNMLRSFINGEGLFIVTSKKKVYMNCRHRMDFQKFERDQETREFEIPKLCLNAPKGTSIFQSSNEIKYSLENQEKIENKYKNVVRCLRKRTDCKPTTPCSSDKKLCQNMLFAEPRPKKDTYYCCVCNENYYNYISHITTNQHKLSSYADDLAVYYNSIDQINSELESEMIHKFLSVPSPEKENLLLSDDSKSNEPLEKVEISNIESRLSYLNEMIDNILYGGSSKQPKYMVPNSDNNKNELVPKFLSKHNSQENYEEEIEQEASQDAYKIFDIENKINLQTAKFNQKEESCGLKCDENLEDSNAVLKNSISLERKIVNEPNKFTFNKVAPEISMQIIEPVLFITPQKKSSANETIISCSNEIKNDCICLNEQNSKTPKSESIMSNETPKFKHIAKRLIDFKDPCIIKANDLLNIESVENKEKGKDNNSCRITLKKCTDSYLSSKDFLKQNKVEFVGVFYSGIFKNENSELPTKKRNMKETRKELDEIVTDIFNNPKGRFIHNNISN